MTMRSIFSFALCLGLMYGVLGATVGPAWAQSLPPTIGGVELSPSVANPSPGQTITITAKSYTIDIRSANITWSVNGRILDRGVGLSTVNVTAPALGKKLTVSVSATTPDDATYTRSLTITSGSVDMIIEADGYVPGIFRGKISPVYQNTVKIVAVPHIAGSNETEMDPKSLVYRWEQNGSVLDTQSGFGKQVVSIPGSMIPRPYVIAVTVSSRDGSAQGKGYVTINQTSPSILFYKNDPLYGPLYNKAVQATNYLGSEREVGILAVPFGFNLPTTGTGEASLKWYINGRERPELANNRTITLRAPQGEAGSSDIQLSITSKRLLQTASQGFRALFNASTAQTQVTF